MGDFIHDIGPEAELSQFKHHTGLWLAPGQ
jgi:hypothetical protein